MRTSTILSQTFGRPGLISLGAALALSSGALIAQELIYKEDFNTDGEAAGRYTTTGKAVYEPDKIRSELNNADQRGPIYWERSSAISFVGVPNIPARRMIFTWRPGTDPAAVTEDLLKLVDSSINWLLEGKKNVKIAVSPNAGAIGVLADRLTTAGHTIIEDDPSILNDLEIVADLYIHGPGGNASRYALVPKPVIVISGADMDDMLTGSIGTATTFEPGQVNIATAGHPAAGGKTGSFNAFIGSQPFELVGRFLPNNAIPLATVDHTVPPAVTRLGDVDEFIAGTKQNSKTAAKVTELDFADNSTGSWPNDNALPGGYTGNWAVQIKGKLTVATAGSYRFAVGSDDGARLQIDRDRNGFTPADTVIEDFGPHGHTIVYEDVSFSASGTFDFEVRSYNSGGNGSLEVSVATQAGDVPDNALDSGFWEVLGAAGAASPVKLQGQADVTAYIATGANTQVREPLIVLLNGPNENPPGFFYGGGSFTGFEGAAYFAGSGMNKWPFPDGQSYRTVQLKPVSVAGKQNVKLTIALAGTSIDFEDSDYLDIVVYPNGLTSTPVTLAHFRGVQNAVQPWLADQKEGYVRRLTREFADFTYDIPAGAANLIVEIRATTSWWNEILALDNIRITSGAAAPPLGVGNLTGLLGYWRMEETSGDVVGDSSGKGNNGKIINNAGGSWIKDAVRGNVYKATGTNVIDFGTILPAMSINNDFTWSIWLNSAETDNNNIVFGNRYNSAGVDFAPREFIKFTPRQFEWHFNGAGQNINYTDFVTNTWVHHLVVKKGDALTYYRDGQEANTGTITGAPSNRQPLYLGGQGTLERWRGLADEVAIFDRALSVAEGKQVYDLGRAGSALAAPPIKIALERTATGLKLTFEGTLQSADKVEGPYTDVAGATSPAQISFSGAGKFYRVKK
ncbi:MAG: hypothetical protein HY735_06980 [Verrucomicrobia bacterium]|nr:hypothetical protein [Verrucomicrobiota bacterium]